MISKKFLRIEWAVKCWCKGCVDYRKKSLNLGIVATMFVLKSCSVTSTPFTEVNVAPHQLKPYFNCNQTPLQNQTKLIKHD